MILEEDDYDDYIMHYGILRRSGRYPWGSGENQSAVNRGFLDFVAEQKRLGYSEKEIAEGMKVLDPENGDISTGQLRAAKTIAQNEQKKAQIAYAEKLKEKGMSNTAAAAQMGIPESTFRSLIAPGAKERAALLTNIADSLQRQVDEVGYLDVGAGTENYLNVSKEKLRASLAILREKGYEVHQLNTPQASGHETKRLVLTPPGVTQKEAWMNQDKIQPITEFTPDGGERWNKIGPPISVNEKRVGINYAEDGGAKADGVIYVREGVPDLSLGNNRYAQVRIKVGDTHYLKGMAVYKDDLPDGVDLLFNTNKTNTGNKLDALKKLEDNKDFPFGAVVRQLHDDKGNVKSAMNIVNEQGNWREWKRSISSQVLSKQEPSLAKEQLDLTYKRRKQEFDEIMALTNPVVKKKLLEDFAGDTDAASVHLKAAGLPRQNWHVILPVNSLKPTEVFAPNYNDGEELALIRYPHGGTFEIPILKVNNKNREARKTIGLDSIDAIGIHHKVAEQLSGADFDGDTVLAIPNNNRKIKNSRPLEALKNFDPKREYPLPDTTPKLKPKRKQQLMGDVSNLITDMTLMGAPHEDIARAVKHSMVVIDAEKHHLDYKRSAKENGIPSLKAKYQGGPRAGAATLVSRKKQSVQVPDRKLRPASQGGPIDRKTGRLVYVPTGKTRIDKSGERVGKNVWVKKLDLTDDARTLMSPRPTRTERLYADHSNRLKDLANEARLQSLKTPKVKWSSTAKQTYAPQIKTLSAQLALAERNAPRERHAQLLTNNQMKIIKRDNPNMSKDQYKKVQYYTLEEMRTRVGAQRRKITISPEEWAAIQSGGVSTSMLNRILKHADPDEIRKYATPKTQKLMTPTNVRRAQTMLAAGATRAEVAEQLGVSVSTLDLSMSDEGG